MKVLSARDQGRMAETCCAEENEINYQIDCFGGFCKKRSGKIDWEEYLPPLKYLIAISLWNFLSDSVFMRHFVILIILWALEGIIWPPAASGATLTTCHLFILPKYKNTKVILSKYKNTKVILPTSKKQKLFF